MVKRSDSFWARYGIALLSIVVATVLRRLLNPIVGEAYPFATIFLAVVFSAWYGGFGPALMASIAGLIAAAVFLAPSAPAGRPAPPALIGLAFYLLATTGIALIGGMMAKARRRYIRQVDETTRQHEQLLATLRSIGDAVMVTDQSGHVILLNPVAESLTGWTATEAFGQPMTEVFQIINEYTRRPVESPVERVVREGTIVGLANHTVLIAKDGTQRPIDDSAAPVRDSQGRLVGVVLVFRDVTERRKADQATARLAAIVSSSEDAIASATLDGMITSWNTSAERVYGYKADEVIGRPFSILVPDERNSEVDLYTARLARGERIDHFETVRKRKDGRLIDVTVSYSPVHGQEGRLVGTSVITRDITEERRANQVTLFLAQASEVLSTLVDLKGTLQKVANLAVPFFADWCVVDLVDAEGVLQRMAVAHVDPKKLEMAHEVTSNWPPDPSSEEGLYQVLRTRKAQLVSDVTDSMLARKIEDSHLLTAFQQIGLRSYMVVPLVVRAKALGVITFAVATSDRRYDERDLAAAQDLARRAAVAIENAELYQALRDADRRKDEFLALLAHELRNPLAPIASALEIMKLPADASAITDARNMAERQLHQLTRLVDDLLDVSRIMRGKIELRKERVELSTIVARSLETTRPRLEAEGHALTVSLPDHPIWLEADVVRVSQVLSNLLSNAIKYTPSGGQICLSADANDSQVEIRVHDTGIGISSDILPHLFDMFMQAAPGSMQSQGGLGIGLTLVKNLVEMHGGKVKASSPGPGKGSEFVVTLPVAPTTTESSTQASDASAERPQPASRTVLVVDDNVDAAQSLAVLLRLQGHTVRVVHDGETAIACVRESQPEVVLLDIGMPGMNGYQVARCLREKHAADELMLVALTGWGQEQDRLRSKEAGFDHHLTKPVELATLQAVLSDREGAARSSSLNPA
jgi:PAS domain S-box-containing protein